MNIKYLIIGAGISGLSFAQKKDDYLIIEKENEVGGLCRTIHRNGYTWDYSGHFFHFKNEKIKKMFLDNISDEDLIEKKKNTKIFIDNQYIDYPFQKNIHQLDKESFIDCLYELYFRKESTHYDSFIDMLYGKFGKGITDRFLRPYNEKLYACPLNNLESGAMGRFFPYADFEDIIRNMKKNDNNSYNDLFWYPKKGAETYIDILKKDIDNNRIMYNCTIEGIDCDKKIAYTNRGSIEYEYLISTMPFNELCSILGINCKNDLSSNKVLVFNMGFDRQADDTDIHWIYYPEKKYNFYRVGFYSNILNEDKLSIYVEIGFTEREKIDVNIELAKTIRNLNKAGIINDHKLVDFYPIIIDPAYVHITEKSEAFRNATIDYLKNEQIFSIGRYGEWKYCSIEDCILMAYKLAEQI